MLFRILGAFAGSALVFSLWFVLAMRATPSARLARLRRAREQMTATLGSGGAFVVFLGAGVFVITVFAIPFGEAIALLQDPVDWKVFYRILDVQHPDWHRILSHIGRMGDIREIWITGLVCAALLTFLAPRGRRWVPIVVIGTTGAVEYYQQKALAGIVDRGAPPSATGTFPSGGCARLISILGISIFLLLVFTHAGRRSKAIAWALLGTLAYLEGFTRLYLNKHWLTDIPSGWLYGYALLGVVIFACSPLLTRREPPSAADNDSGTHHEGRLPQVRAS